MQNQVQYSQQSNSQQTGDILDQLPSDQSVPSHNEIRILDALFKQKKSTFDNILKHMKNILILGLLFIIFSLPPVDEIIIKIIKVAGTSPYILIGVKALLFMLAYFFIENFYLARNK